MSFISLRNKIFIAVFVVALVIVLGVAVFASPWSGPTATPPEGNVPPPINVSGIIQTKQGGLNIMGNVGIGTLEPDQKLDVEGYVKGRTGLCIGDDCRESWPDFVNVYERIGNHCGKAFTYIAPSSNIGSLRPEDGPPRPCDYNGVLYYPDIDNPNNYGCPPGYVINATGQASYSGAGVDSYYVTCIKMP